MRQISIHSVEKERLFREPHEKCGYVISRGLFEDEIGRRYRRQSRVCASEDCGWEGFGWVIQTDEACASGFPRYEDLGEYWCERCGGEMKRRWWVATSFVPESSGVLFVFYEKPGLGG